MGVASLDLQQTDVGQGKIDYGNIVNNKNLLFHREPSSSTLYSIKSQDKKTSPKIKKNLLIEA